mmetsp:Transcript_49685/g.117438  ORF Transcript_49685/g.117438 Transcript_49685/m.117438 type:complete len:131 (+) Transcript_49685:177-569(+)|eukprot:CAMPEP_0180228374 /NCGR_PEP_ID=MMETSP0987-20121128/24729_1 /TAXON_ID=697907 /ORGANISM="non described non described, Strain CCMP2293" /LENGTH=130 /DNA_ID=CAMNT_0022192563 /DNA_START=150 /DNA_END=542 /DNA_ORIENTATION=-
MKSSTPAPLSSHRGERHAEQAPAAPGASDTSMDLDSPDLSELAFHFDEDSYIPAIRELEAVKAVRSVTALPERCAPAPRHSSPRDITSFSFMDVTARDQLEQLANKTLTSRHAGGSGFDCMPMSRSSCPA